MITVVRTASALPGETGDAIAWAKEVARLVKRVTGKEQVVATAFAGLLSDIAWIAQYDNITQFDELRTKVLSDEQYIDALKKARNLFVPGSLHDHVWKHE
jgi:hypothetical protein